MPSPSCVTTTSAGDGTGYPDRLRGEGIPVAARIVSVVDAFDAMISDRPYRKGIPVDDALREIAQGAGLQFDPRGLRGVPVHRPRGCGARTSSTERARAGGRCAAPGPGIARHLLDSECSGGRRPCPDGRSSWGWLRCWRCPPCSPVGPLCCHWRNPQIPSRVATSILRRPEGR